MCNFDNTRVRSHPQYLDLCQRTTAASCCPSWTLGNYIAVLTNKSSCQMITERDVSHTLKILRSCAKYYHNGTLGPECWDMTTRKKDLKCGNVPRKCAKYNAVYQIFHFLVDKDFLNPKNMDYLPPNLKYSMLFSPTEKGETMMNIYLDNFENWNSSDGITTITGIEFGIKHNLFQDYLLTDTMYPAIAIVIVLVVMCIYTRSMFITLMTMFAIISSLIVSYFLYRVIFNFDFFPFMNLTALIILVGIGADDAFVLCDVWNYTKFDKPNSELSETVSVTLQHAALSMFVTSFTTAAAFYANYVSNITAIRCFGVYAGTAILVNYILMVTWLPAVVVLHERYLVNLFTCSQSQHHQTEGATKFWKSLYQMVNKCLFSISEAARIFFEKVLPCIVIKLRYLWLLWFLAMMVFRSSHPFERYDAEYKKLFMFERVNHGEDLHMPITIIWGVTPVDNGDPLSPKNKGKLTLDTTFNIASPASQQWMENQDCEEASVYPCCSQSTFPYRQDVFELCIKRAIMELDRSTIYHLDSKTPGPREVDAWIQEELTDAPEGLSYGCFYAIISIAGTIFVTVGSLVLLEPDREGKVVFSLSRMGSAIAMAALTTFGTCGQIPLPKKLQCYSFQEHTSENQSNPNQGKLGACYTAKYQIDNARSEGRHEHYELEPLALNVRNEEKASDEIARTFQLTFSFQMFSAVLYLT
ncbi:hypothetical protein cypCar_00035414 [Cyprinus carpio]|nr:hypothetical protein cypCar_00035414 [Cyprinus carpio]